MARSFFHLRSSILVCCIALGCSSNEGTDSNTQVFKTPEQAAAIRKQKLLIEWQELAARIANSDRPDARTGKHPTQGFALLSEADGVRHTIDLGPIAEKLSSATGKEREPIRAHLATEFAAFDRERLRKLGFEGARELLYPLLANTKQTAELVPGAAPGSGAAPVVNPVVIDLNWVPVARWPKGEAVTPITPEIVSAWNSSPAAVSNAALANLKRDYITQVTSGQPPYETLELPGLGRTGSFRSEMPAAYVLLPEFLTAVRRQWKTDDDLVAFLASRSSVVFLERKNEKLLNKMVPQWKELYTKVSEPLSDQLVLLTEAGPRVLSYKAPATTRAAQPATKPKPTGYIVR